jgi:hypothetical protein
VAFGPLGALKVRLQPQLELTLAAIHGGSNGTERSVAQPRVDAAKLGMVEQVTASWVGSTCRAKSVARLREADSGATGKPFLLRMAVLLVITAQIMANSEETHRCRFCFLRIVLNGIERDFSPSPFIESFY